MEISVNRENSDMVDSDSILPSTRTEIRLDKSAFDRLKTEKSFWCIVAMSRVVNALRFVHAPLKHYQDDSPEALHARYNSFLFNCALFWEASILVQQLKLDCDQLSEYQAVASLMNTKEAQELLQSNLKGTRNKFVFHFERDEVGEQLAALELDKPVFASALGTSDNFYYQLADLCALTGFSGAALPESEAAWQHLEQLIKKTTTLTQEFLAKAELFIVAVLINGGWKMVVIPAESRGGHPMETSGDAVQTLSDRLARLERSNRRLRLLVGGILVVSGVLSVLVLRPKLAGTAPRILTSDLVLSDGKGRTGAELSFHRDGQPTLTLYGQDENRPATAILKPDELGLKRSDSGSTSLLEGGLFMYDAKGEQIIDIGSALGAQPAVRMWGSNRREVWLSAEESGPTLGIRDDAGFEADLGSAEVVSRDTGEKHRTSAASLTLFGKDGKVLWSAPR